MSTPTDTMKNRHSRTRFIGVVVALIALVVVIRFAVLPILFPILDGSGATLTARLLESAGVALLTGLLVPLLAIWLGPDSEAKETISILDRKLETTPAFDAALRGAQKWCFRGGLGSFFRKTTLPTMLQQQGPIEIHVVLLDVNNLTLIRNYASYRTALAGRDLAPAEIRDGILRSIWDLARAVRDRGGGQLAHATVSFVGTFSSFRVDLSDREVFLTQDNPDAPALRFTAESSFYKGFNNEFTQLGADAVDLVPRLRNRGAVSPAELFRDVLRVDVTDDELGGLSS